MALTVGAGRAGAGAALDSWGGAAVPQLTPQPQRLSVLGLGGSVATPAEGVSAPVVVVQSFAELSPELARDKIVLFAPPFSGYESGVPFRLLGAVKAALKRGHGRRCCAR
jgi:carboxypeptidase Q